MSTDLTRLRASRSVRPFERPGVAAAVAKAKTLAALLPLLPGDEIGRDPLDLLICNCVACHKFLLGESERGFYQKAESETKERLPEPVAGRRMGRPYCLRCLNPGSDGSGTPLPPKPPRDGVVRYQ